MTGIIDVTGGRKRGLEDGGEDDADHAVVVTKKPKVHVPEWVVFYGKSIQNGRGDMIYRFDQTSTVNAPTLLETLQKLAFSASNLYYALEFLARSNPRNVRDAVDDKSLKESVHVSIRHWSMPGLWEKETNVNITQRYVHCTAFTMFRAPLVD